MELLEVRGVSKIYNGGTKALSGIDFSVSEGEFISIIGPSGAGKSTLLRCINRMIEATEGKIQIDGIDILNVKKNDLKRIRRKIGMIFQHYNLVNRLSALENVLHGRLGYKTTVQGILGLYDEQENEKAFALLEKLGVSDQAYKRCDQLSGGQKQRIGIARALIQDPRIVLCDEPIASLDPNASKIIMDHLYNINKEMGITCLLNLHQVDVAVKYSSRIIGINNGAIVYDGTPSNLTKDHIKAIYGAQANQLITE